MKATRSVSQRRRRSDRLTVIDDSRVKLLQASRVTTERASSVERYTWCPPVDESTTRAHGRRRGGYNRQRSHKNSFPTTLHHNRGTRRPLEPGWTRSSLAFHTSVVRATPFAPFDADKRCATAAILGSTTLHRVSDISFSQTATSGAAIK